MSIGRDLQVDIRPSKMEDRDAIYSVLVNSHIFSQADAECVDEMFVESWDGQSDGADSYRWLSCWYQSRVVGFACSGPEPLTIGAWALYWICVLPEMRGKRIGTALMREAENQARSAGGRVMVIYTSSVEKYEPARRLYEGAGFVRAAVVPDYYANSDNMAIYWKRIRPA